MKKKDNRGIDQTNLIKCHKEIGMFEPPKKKICIGTVNARSIKSKLELLHEMVTTFKIDLLIITETWLSNTENDQTWLDSSFLNQQEFKSYHICRENRKGGGILLLSRAYFQCKQVKKSKYPTFEGATWNIHIGNTSLNITGIYHPPPSARNVTTNAMFTDQLSDYLLDLLSDTSNHIITGDFNIHVNDPSDVDAAVLLDTMSALGLKQHVDIPTHNKGNTLDLIFTEDIGYTKVESIGTGGFLSDHKIILCSVAISKPKLKPLKKKIRKLNVAVIERFKEVYNHDCLTGIENPTDQVKKFESELLDTLNKVAPIKEKQVHPRPLQFWYNEDLHVQKRLVRNRERIWLKYQSDATWKAYKRERNRYNFMLKYAKTQHLQQSILDSKGDTKKLYRVVNKTIGKRDDNPLPTSVLQ